MKRVALRVGIPPALQHSLQEPQGKGGAVRRHYRRGNQVECMKIYISGPISTQTPDEADLEERKGRFAAAERHASRLGLDPVSPLKVEACKYKVECGGDPDWGHTWECWLKYDLIAMFNCEAIVMLPFWQLSKGARLELHVAENLGFRTYVADGEGRFAL